MALFKGTPVDLSNLVLAGLERQLRDEIRKRMYEILGNEIDALALEATQKLTANVESAYYREDNKIHLSVYFKDKKLD